MKGNEGKCQLLLSTDETVQVNIGTARINNSKYEKLFGIKIDCNLSPDDHVGNIYKKAAAKLKAFTRVAQYINTKKVLIYESPFFRHNLINALFHGCSTTSR